MMFGNVCAFFQAPLPYEVYQEPPETEYKQPWKSPPGKRSFMVKMAARLLTKSGGHPDPVADACITQALKRDITPKKTGFPLFRTEESRRCEQVMSKCGACHLPRENSCEYRVTWRENHRRKSAKMFVYALEKESIRLLKPGVQSFPYVKYEEGKLPLWESRDGKLTRGYMLKSNDTHITLKGPEGIHRIPLEKIYGRRFRDIGTHKFVRGGVLYQGITKRIPIKSIEKIEWLNGGDPLAAWWDFKRLSPRGRKAKRMFDIATRHQVGCTNCHVGHGDFQLTRDGRVFQESGKVIRRVPLDKFLGGG